MNQVIDESTMSLAARLRQIALASEDLIAVARQGGDERALAAIKRLERQLRRAQEDANDMERSEEYWTLPGMASKAQRITHTNPLIVAGGSALLAAGIGVLLGIVIGRR